MTLEHGVTLAAARGAALFAARELGTIAVGGADRVSWLNGLLSSDLSRLGPHVASYGLVLLKTGRILTDAWVVAAADRLLVGVRRDRLPLARDHFEKHLMMEDVVEEDVSDGFSWALAHGPLAEGVARQLAPDYGGYEGEVDVTGLGGAAIVVPASGFDALLVDAPARGENVVLGSETDWDSLRVERSFPRFGVDYGESNYPQEASLEQIAVSFTKGCYVGQEVVCKLQLRGHVSKKLVALGFAQAEAPPPGAQVRSGQGRELGTTSSSTGAIALAMLARGFAEPGTVLDVEGRQATVLGR